MLNRKLGIVGILGLSMVFGVVGGSAVGEDVEVRPVKPGPGKVGKKAVKRRPLIQVALLLDTSNSMDGLINQAKAELWRVVNEFISAKQDGVRPEMQVALIEYGNNGLSAESGHTRIVAPLTGNLDLVSEKLFGLRTNGGQEYCGRAIQLASSNLKWSGNHNDLKVIFIAGNEPFSQGKVDYRVACKSAIGKGIVVNTIHCGPGIPKDWAEGARLADGVASYIDQNRVVARIDAPQDKQLLKLSGELNKTYIPFGRHGKQGEERQLQQDRNASGVSKSSALQRAVTKGNRYYDNSLWCLADAYTKGKVKIERVKASDLPEIMRKMTMKERKAYVQKKLDERAKLQKQINELKSARDKYVAAKRRDLSKNDKKKGADGLESALIKSLRSQAAKKRFKLK